MACTSASEIATFIADFADRLVDKHEVRMPGAQQILSLLKIGDPRFVVYDYGQALKPARDSIRASDRVCTNYQVTAEVARLLRSCSESLTREALQDKLNLRDRKSFRETYLNPALSSGFIEMTIPDKPTSRLQKYRLTEKGRAWLAGQ